MLKTPKETFLAAEAVSVAKAKKHWSKTLISGTLAGSYIGLGGLLAIIVGGGVPQIKAENPGLQKFIFGGVFPVGLMLVLICGAELFTGNTFVMVVGALKKKISWKDLARNWALSYVGNIIGSIFVAGVLSYWTDLVDADPYRSSTIAIAEKKAGLDIDVMFFRGIGCNWLVCLAVYMALASEDIISKIFAIWFPIMAFVAIGFEHCVANMFFIPLGMMANGDVSFWECCKNIGVVTVGNIVGGSILVAGVYYYLYGYEVSSKSELPIQMTSGVVTENSNSNGNGSDDKGSTTEEVHGQNLI
eukprot:TRINITY_DN773034_c0_g1_i1.p1 TRINITY_DN773034_c0_g1~~TRINITY_DN773034_c0_g1_i1.p1  ORF type:complete len:302 (-),score=95.03 TRINITY_DN773034_c0_g1_i1:254-1159(-)